MSWDTMAALQGQFYSDWKLFSRDIWRLFLFCPPSMRSVCFLALVWCKGPIFPNGQQGSSVCNQNMFLNTFGSLMEYSGFGSKSSIYCAWSSFPLRNSPLNCALVVVSGHGQYLLVLQTDFPCPASSFSLRSVIGRVGVLSSRGCFRCSPFSCP